MKIPFNEKWILFEREDYANYFFVYSTWEGYTYMPKEWGFENGRFMGAEFVNGACNLFMPLTYFEEMNRKNYQSLFTEPRKWDTLHKINHDGSEKLFKFSREILKKKAGELSDKEIYQILKEFFRIQNYVHVPRGPIWQLETPRNILNDYLNEYLSEQKEESKAQIELNDAYRIFTTPDGESILAKEKKELVKIALGKDKKEREYKLHEHSKKYEWLEYGLQGRVLNVEHFREEMLKILKNGPKKVIYEIEVEMPLLLNNRKEILKKLKIGASHRRIFKIVRDSLAVRLYSKYAQFFGYYALEPILKEFGKRHGLTLEETRFLSIDDYSNFIIKNKKIDLARLAREHKAYSVQISDQKKTKIWTGSEAEQVMKKITWPEDNTAFSSSEIIKGQVAFKGKAKGRVKIVNTVQEIAKMHKGNVLVSHMTNPDIVPAMKMASAIVTDLGGITCHAAIVARELKTPCIIGTKIATKVLKDGDMVEVNAERGLVTVLKKK